MAKKPDAMIIGTILGGIIGTIIGDNANTMVFFMVAGAISAIVLKRLSGKKRRVK